MEVSGIVYRPLPRFPGAAIDATAHSHHSSPMKPCFPGDLRIFSAKPIRKLKCSGFSDEGHVLYYDGPVTTRCSGGSGKKEEKEKKTAAKKMKKKLKLLKGLSKNLSNFSEIGFGLDPDHGLADQVKGQMISEAAELLLGQLQRLRAEDMELKSKQKEEKAKLKAARMQTRMNCEESSSSSESSDSECGEVVDMSSLKNQTLTPPDTVFQETTLAQLPSPLTTELVGSATRDETGFEVELSSCQKCCSGSTANCTSSSSSTVNVGQHDVANTTITQKIEVCMGGKCKKSGAAMLLEEFERVVGAEGAVVGCKCMGKCRDGPNVRVVQSNSIAETDQRVDTSSVMRMAASNPLCIGVGLEDVGLIVSNFFGGNQKPDAVLGQPQPAGAAA